MTDPLVSIILPVYNAEKYIEESIRSILNQSYKNFELIVVNDGSNDDSHTILTNLASEDSRISLYTQVNHGLVYTLNKMISLCKGEYIARMDADDIAYPDRISTQVAHLIQHSDVAVVGSSYIAVDSEGKKMGVKRNVFCSASMVKASMPFGCPVAHPTVMFNRAVCGSELYYSPEFLHAEDIELWTRLVFLNNLKIENIKKPLLYYRIHDNSVSRVHSKEQQYTAFRCFEKHEIFNKFEGGNGIGKIYNTGDDLSVIAVIKLNIINFSDRTFSKSALFIRSLIAFVKLLK